MTWPIVADISNYDFDADVGRPRWADEFLAAGISGIIVGSQWPYKATAQIEAAKAAGLRVIGTYAEPDAASAIQLAQACGAGFVGLACERGGIETYSAAIKARDMVRNAGLLPWFYGNVGDLTSIVGGMLYTELVWLANYGTNDPANPRSPITEMNFGSGLVKLAAHQYSSTIVVAGRNRDHSYLYMEDDMGMTPAERAEFDAFKRAVFAGSEQPGDDAARTAYANFKIEEGGQSVNDTAQSAIAVALQSTGAIHGGMSSNEARAVIAEELRKARIVLGG